MRSLATMSLMIMCVTQVHAADAPIERHYSGPWEKEIGYAGATQVGHTLYVSGIACSGENMQAAVTECYRRIEQLLSKFNANADNIIKENVYTVDIEALKKCIPDRKTFYKNANYPAATWVQVSRLFDPKHLLEIEVTVQL